MRFAILATHPVQYQACWYKALSNHPELDPEVLYCHRTTKGDQAAAGFGIEFEWDTPLLDGYNYKFLKNIAAKPSQLTFMGMDTPEIFEVVQKGGYGAVIVCGWHFKSAWQAMIASWRLKIPVIVRGDSHLHSPRSIFKNAVKLPFYSAAIPRFDACLAVGKWSRDYFLYYGAKPTRTFHVPHYVDPAIFTRTEAERLRLRGTFRNMIGIDESCCAILFSGKFISKKRPLDFVSALAIAARQGTKALGIMVGDGPLRSECERLATYEGLEIHFAGFMNQREIVLAYAGCDMLVLPSDGGETWGLVVNEAMEFGKPCLLSDKVGAGPDLVEPGATGDVFACQDVNALALLIHRYAANLSHTRRMGSAVSRKIALYSEAVAVEGTFQALHAVERK